MKKRVCVLCSNYYLPFSAGPRNCVGARVAAAEMKAILAQLVCRYRVRASPTTVPNPPIPMLLLTLYPSPIDAVFERRA